MTGMTMTDAQKDYIVEFLKVNPDIMFSAYDIVRFCQILDSADRSVMPHLNSVSGRRGIKVVDSVPGIENKRHSTTFFGVATKEHSRGTRCFYSWCLNGDGSNHCPKGYRGDHDLKFYGIDYTGDVKIPKRREIPVL